MSKSKNLDDLLSSNNPLNRASRLAGVLENVSSTRALEGAMVVPIANISPNFFQVRQEFDQEALAELAADIRARGILEPLIVRETEPGQYQIVAGERRYRAAEIAGLTELPVIVRQMDDREARFATLAENLQRQDLSPADEQRYFQMLQTEYNLSFAEIANLINKSKGYVQNRIEGRIQSLQENRSSQLRKLDNSQSTDGTTPDAVTKPIASISRYNPAIYKRVSQFFNNTLQVLESKPDKETVAKIRESVADARQKLEELEKKLAEARDGIEE